MKAKAPSAAKQLRLLRRGEILLTPLLGAHSSWSSSDLATGDTENMFIWSASFPTNDRLPMSPLNRMLLSPIDDMFPKKGKTSRPPRQTKPEDNKHHEETLTKKNNEKKKTHNTMTNLNTFIQTKTQTFPPRQQARQNISSTSPT